MNKILAIILSLCFVTCLISCNNNGLTDDEIHKIVQEEIEKKDKFNPGDELQIPVGNNFTLPIEGTDSTYATITSVSAKKLRGADINNPDDYYNGYYYRYLYEIKIVGKVDEKYAGKRIAVRMQFEYYSEAYGLGNTGATQIADDGTFEITYIAHSNANENVIIPNSVSVWNPNK